MQHEDKISLRQKATQKAIFNAAERDYGLTLKAISIDSGIGYTTIQSYHSGHAVMSIASLFKLVGVIPDVLLSELLPDGHNIVSTSEQTDHDDFAQKCIDLVTATAAAHRPDSECAERIGPNEGKRLQAKRTALRSVA